MQSPFSPFVHRRQALKRRQSELPSDLIDWDAPEIPEVEKQRIVYEDYIKELKEDHVIEDLINEEVVIVAHETLLDSVIKQVSAQNNTLLNQNNLLLNQHRIQEDAIKEWEEQYKEQELRIKELVEQNKELIERDKERDGQNKELIERDKVRDEQNKELIERDKERDEQYKELEFRNKELEAEISCRLDATIQMNNEIRDLKMKLDATKNAFSYFKKQRTNEKK